MSITHETHKPTIAIDVDGVIADYSKGFQGPDIIGDPLPGARKFLDRLQAAGWKIIIFTTRGKEVMKYYCLKHGLYYDEINDNSSLRGENPGKVIANIYIDDRAIRFNGDFEKTFDEIMRFKVWYEPTVSPVSKMTFGQALATLKSGQKVARRGWNGKGMWLLLQRPDEFSKMTLPYVYIEYPAGHPAYPNGSRVPWLASQTDMLAEDWEIVE